MFLREISSEDSCKVIGGIDRWSEPAWRWYDHRMADKTAYERFIASMTITQEMWHDGIGYEIDALSQMTPEELTSLAQRMKECGDWRDVEALAAIASPGNSAAAKIAIATLKARAKSNDQIGLRRRGAGRIGRENRSGRLDRENPAEDEERRCL